MAASWRCESSKRLHPSAQFVHRAAVPRLELFPVRYRNPVTGKWVRARYVATREEIAKANAEWEIIGPPETREVDRHARYFTPFRVKRHAEAMRMFDTPPQLNPHLERPPAIDSVECFLTTLFLRRYVVLRTTSALRTDAGFRQTAQRGRSGSNKGLSGVCSEDERSAFDLQRFVGRPQHCRTASRIACIN